MDAEHPIPQEVSSYQFKLVGDMTIQQFFQVAGGALVSLVIYSTNMAGYVRWPLIIISFLTGVAFAFFPIEDRPLTKWLVLFMKAIYSPTVYVWNKQAVRHEFFQPENDPMMAQAVQQVAASGTVQDASQPIVPNSTVPDTELDKLEKNEEQFLDKVDKEFTIPVDEPIIKTAPVVRTDSTLADTQTNQSVSVPDVTATKIDTQSQNQTTDQNKGNIFQSSSSVGNQVSPIASQNLASAQAATFAPEAAPPSPPTRPNVVVGQVMDTSGKIIDSAILEIKDSDGRSLRALRTNRLGHFMIVTPLANGKYQIVTEKEGFKFDPVTIELNNRVIPPIAITGQKNS